MAGVEADSFDDRSEAMAPDTDVNENTAAGDYTLEQGHGLRDVGMIVPGVNDQGFARAAPDVGVCERGGSVAGNDAGLPDGWAGVGGTAGGAAGQTGGAGGAVDGGTPALL